jgi:8-oxo-dGTP diphosphatase
MITETTAPPTSRRRNDPSDDRRCWLFTSASSHPPTTRSLEGVPHIVHLGGASGLIVADGRVLLIRRGKEPYKDHWSLPGGGVERGERVRDTVRREVREETGLEVDVGLVAGYREELLPDAHYIVIAFHCTVTGGDLRAGDDAAEAEFVDPEKIFSRKITPGLEDVFHDAGLI